MTTPKKGTIPGGLAFQKIPSLPLTEDIMNTPTRLTEAVIHAALKEARTEEMALHDPAVPGLSLRIYPSGTTTWTQFIRVVGEGGVNKHGKRLLGRKHRLSLGNYPEVSSEAARAQANRPAHVVDGLPSG